MEKTHDPRKIFGKRLLSIGYDNERVLAVSCDSASGGGIGTFVDNFPNRYIEVGISEQNAVGVSVGLAEKGYIPVLIAITPFITMRCYEQIRDDVGYSCMNVKIVGSGGGLAYSTLGFTHMAVEDIAIMRTIPNMTILVPGDTYEVGEALQEAIIHKGPVYIRMPRHPMENLLDSKKRSFKIGQIEKLEDGCDLAIFSTGTLVREAQKASNSLKGMGIQASVYDVHTIKPLDEDLIREVYSQVKMVVTVEEHSVTGGLGSAIGQLMVSTKTEVPTYNIGVNENSSYTGPYNELLDFYGFTAERLVETVSCYYENLY